MRKGKSKIVLVLLLAVGALILAAWDLIAFPEYVHEFNSEIPFNHEKHGEALGLDCEKCHVGAKAGIRAGMPTRADCMDCHNLPLTESEVGERLDSVLPEAPEKPFRFVELLPSNVVFPHGLHAKAGVSCETCHGTRAQIDSGYRPKVRMEDCLACHRGERGFPKASTDCARCHR